MKLTADDVEWVVNDMAELGVKIEGQFFWLYKGHSLVYDEPRHGEDAGTRAGAPIMWRRVGKREFGETCHPLRYCLHPHEPIPFPYDVELEYHPALDAGIDREFYSWQPLPAIPQ